MSGSEAVRRAADLTAAACARVLGLLVGTEGTFRDVAVEEGVDPWASLTFPSVAVRIAFIEGIQGDYLFVLPPDQCRRLAAGMMGMAESDVEGDLNELELSAVAEAMNQMMGSVATALAETLGTTTDIAPPEQTFLADREAADALGKATFTARFTLEAGSLSSQLVMLVPEPFAAMLESAFTEVDTAGGLPGGELATKRARLGDATRAAVERTSRIAADTSAEVLTTLVGAKVTATAPEIEVEPGDPLGQLPYPLVTIEVSYVAGVNGASLIALAPSQAAAIAAAMMGADEPSGDGLSDIELSAVSEAMNQIMGAATIVLAGEIGVPIEVAPPVCEVIASAAEARESFEWPAYATTFQLVSDRLAADVIQLFPADFSLRLAEALGTTGAAPMAAAASAPSAAVAAAMNAAAASSSAMSLDIFQTVQVRVSAELGRARLGVAEAMNLPPGAIIELDRLPTDTIDILVNGRPFAQARLVLVDGEYAAQIVSLSPPPVAV
jgi:flagellar motor switch protein FliN/FliY